MAKQTTRRSTVTETPEQALARIQSGFSQNDMAVIAAFAAKGYDPARIEPRVNVLTYKAWRAKGRQVMRGEKATKITIWIPVKREDGKRDGMIPRSAAVFHIDQTKPAE